MSPNWPYHETHLGYLVSCILSRPPVGWDLYGFLTSAPDDFYDQVYLSYALLGEIATQAYFRGFAG